MKNLLKHIMIIGIMIGMSGFFCLCEGQGKTYGGKDLMKTMPYDNQEKVPTDQSSSDKTILGDQVSTKEKDSTILVRLLDVFGLDTDLDKDHKFLDYTRAIINMALGLISFVALLMTIYTFYMMFFSENEAGIKKAKGNLIGIFIALAIVGLAWLIVSVIFRRYERYRQEREDFIQSSTLSINFQHKEPLTTKFI